jgi:ATP-dependent DNA ligase
MGEHAYNACAKRRSNLNRSKLRFIEPQLPSLVDQPPEGKHWIHEIKHDGYRCQVLVERGKARVFTRNGFDWSDRYPSIVRATAKLRCQSAIIGGEAIVQYGDGASNFEALRSAMVRQPYSIILYAFDLLHLDSKDLIARTSDAKRSGVGFGRRRHAIAYSCVSLREQRTERCLMRH